LAAFAISTIFSDSPARSSLKLIGVFYLAAIALVTLQLAANEKLFKWIVLAFAAGTGLTVAAAAVGLAGFYAGFDDPRTNFLLFKFGSLPSGHYPRVQALFSNANMMCNYLNIGLMCTLLSVRLNWLPRYLGIPLVLATLAASALTISPGIGGILLSLGIWVWNDEARIPDLLFRRVILSTAVIGAVLMFAAAATSIDTPNTDLDVPIPLTHISVEPSVRALIWGTGASSA
jgi:hypothetical protein